MSTTVVRPIDPATPGYYISQYWGVVDGVQVPGGVGGHSGTDYAVPAGTPIRSAADGEVLYAGPASGFGDHAVAIWHPDLGVSTTYGHGEAHFVNTGDTVTAGQHIADVDSQGFSTGNHLHFEVRPMNAPWGGNPPNIDGEAWLSLHLSAPVIPGLGPKDREAIVFLQRVGLRMPAQYQTGFWGPLTDQAWQTLRWKSLINNKGFVLSSTLPGQKPVKATPTSQIKECQRALFHFAASDQDGIWGAKTDAAFQLARMCWLNK